MKATLYSQSSHIATDLPQLNGDEETFGKNDIVMQITAEKVNFCCKKKKPLTYTSIGVHFIF